MLQYKFLALIARDESILSAQRCMMMDESVHMSLHMSLILINDYFDWMEKEQNNANLKND